MGTLLSRFSLSALLRDPDAGTATGLRVAAAHGFADIDERQLLSELLAFDAEGRSGVASFDRLIEAGEYAAAEQLLDETGAEVTDLDRRTFEERLVDARQNASRASAEQARILLERTRALLSEIPPAVQSAVVCVTSGTRRSRIDGANALASARRIVDEMTVAQREALRAKIDMLAAHPDGATLALRAGIALDGGHLDIARALLAGAPGTDDSAVAALSAPRPRRWIESTSLEDAIRWLSTHEAPPGFDDLWRPHSADANAWSVIAALSDVLDAWPPRSEIFARFASALDRLLGGTGAIALPRSENGALSVRLPSLHLPDALWFRPASHPQGLLLVVPIVSGASVPSETAVDEPIVALRLRESLNADRRAIRIEGVQLVPLLKDPDRATNVWRMLGVRTPLGGALAGVDALLFRREGSAWNPAPGRVRDLARTLVDFLGLDVEPTLIDAVIQISGGIPALALAMLEALLALVQERSTGRTGTITVDDLRVAFWHDLYLGRVWSHCLTGYAEDSEVQRVFAAVRCASGGPSVETQFAVRLQEVAEWTELAGLDVATTERALQRLEASGLVTLLARDGVVVGQRAGLALVAARKQGPAEQALLETAQAK
jgi:hypothetical protein